MNERIRELMEQVVRIEIDPDSNCETIYTCGPEEFLEFAELIVRECMEVANTYQNRGGNCYVHNMIAKHFGVEEYNDEGDEE